MPCSQKLWQDWPERCARALCRVYLLREILTARVLQIGSYHYVSGVDASSSASLAAYINSLTYGVEDNSTWFAKGNQWKVRSGCYWSARFAPSSWIAP